MLSNTEKAKVFKYYLKQYFVKPDIEVYKEFQEAIANAHNTCYCQGTRYALKQCGLAYLDYKQTFINHTQIYSYDLLNNFLHLGENTSEKEIFYEYPDCPLVVYHPRGTTDNNRLMSLITHLISYRDLNKQKTLILSERAIKGVISDTITPITDLSNICNLIDNELEPETEFDFCSNIESIKTEYLTPAKYDI